MIILYSCYAATLRHKLDVAKGIKIKTRKKFVCKLKQLLTKLRKNYSFVSKNNKIRTYSLIRSGKE